MGFYSGFLYHPYLAFWLGTHCIGKGSFEAPAHETRACLDGLASDNVPEELLASAPAGTHLLRGLGRSRRTLEGAVSGVQILDWCQPTMSTYSRLSAALTANLTYHVE